jgi:hypothetical protein
MGFVIKKTVTKKVCFQKILNITIMYFRLLHVIKNKY